ncbi:MAG: hypothetical protein WCJ14_08190 [Verrucomicrobiota bacterium]
MKSVIPALAAASLASANADQYWKGDNAANHWQIHYGDTTGCSNLSGQSGYQYATITPIPESSAAGLGGLGMLMLLRRRRRGMKVFRVLRANSREGGVAGVWPAAPPC